MLKNNLNRIDSDQFEVNQLKDHVSHLDEEMNKLRSELEDAPNRGLRKTLIFKNIPFQYVTRNPGMKVKIFFPKK